MNNSTKFQNQIRDLISGIMGQGVHYSERRKHGRRFKWLHDMSSTREEFLSRMKKAQEILASAYTEDAVVFKKPQKNNYPGYQTPLLGFSVYVYDGDGVIDSDYEPRKYKVNPKQPTAKWKGWKKCPNWQNNAVQFPRLIAEANAMGAFSSHRVKEMAESMNIETDDVLELVDRAEAEWEKIKENWGFQKLWLNEVDCRIAVHFIFLIHSNPLPWDSP